LIEVKVHQIVLCMRLNPLGLGKATKGGPSAAFDAPGYIHFLGRIL
jgi:hypothetical protein